MYCSYSWLSNHCAAETGLLLTQRISFALKLKVKIKVKFTLEEATKAQRGSRCIALYSFINLGARWGWVATPCPGCFTPGKDPVPLV